MIYTNLNTRMKSIVGLGVVLFALSACASSVTRHPEFGTDCIDLDANVECVSVFYGTNRAVRLQDQSDRLQGKLQRDVERVEGYNANILSFGRADVWLPRLVSQGGERELGETPLAKGKAPKERREQERFVFVTRITADGKERFVNDLSKAMKGQYSDSILLFIHGFNVKFESAIIRSAQLAVDLGEGYGFNPGAPVLFSWPSAGRLSLKSYFNDGEAARDAAPYLSKFLDVLTQDLKTKRINIVAHSMGNRVLTAALEDYATDYLQNHLEQDIEFRIVLAAADMERDVFDLVADNIVDLDPNVTIYASDDDLALNFSKLLNGKPRLGDTNGNKPYIRQEEGYETIDATPVATELFGLGHNYYSEDPFILNDIRCALADTPPVQRALDQRNFNDQSDQPSFYLTDPNIEPDFRYCALSRKAYPATREQLDAGIQEDPTPVLEESVDAIIAAPAPRAPRTTVPPSSAPPVFDRAPSAPASADLYLYKVFFATGRSDLKPEQIAELLRRIRIANEVGELKKIRVTGYADSQGDSARNLVLSRKRAETVANYLIADGVDPDIIEINAIGEKNAVRDDTPDESARRVEVEFIF